jgi:hypothetical protein
MLCFDARRRSRLISKPPLWTVSRRVSKHQPFDFAANVLRRVDCRKPGVAVFVRLPPYMWKRSTRRRTSIRASARLILALPLWKPSKQQPFDFAKLASKRANVDRDITRRQFPCDERLPKYAHFDASHAWSVTQTPDTCGCLSGIGTPFLGSVRCDQAL